MHVAGLPGGHKINRQFCPSVGMICLVIHLFRCGSGALECQYIVKLGGVTPIDIDSVVTPATGVSKWSMVKAAQNVQSAVKAAQKCH